MSIKKINDISEKLNYRLLQGRFGIYNSYKSHNTIASNELKGVENQELMTKWRGGNFQQDRMIADKKKSLQRALHYSYQGADVKKVGSDIERPLRALINPNKLKQDYDDKILSIFYDYEFAVGDIFEWVGTNTYWLIYLQDLTELAYFRGNIRKCSHTISWKDGEEVHSTYVAIKGPIETRIESLQKHGLVVDVPNHSLTILMPKTEAALKYFKRYQKFYLTGDKEHNICWRVEATDWLSTPGILQIIAVEYYSNETEDDIENGIVGGLIAEPVSPNSDFIEEMISGETFIKPKMQYEFVFNGKLKGKWSVKNDEPVEIIQDGKTVKVRWLQVYSGQFDLYYADTYKKTIIVESLF